MVRYTGRAKTQTGMNTNQVGLKMSGCPSRVGRKGTIIRKFNQRVNCMEGLCGGAKLNGKMWRTTYRNKEPFCKKRSTKCAQAAGGVGRINAPYFNRKVRAGESGCTPAAVAAAAGPAGIIALIKPFFTPPNAYDGYDATAATTLTWSEEYDARTLNGTSPYLVFVFDRYSTFNTQLEKATPTYQKAVGPNTFSVEIPADTLSPTGVNARGRVGGGDYMAFVVAVAAGTFGEKQSIGWSDIGGLDAPDLEYLTRLSKSKIFRTSDKT